MGGFGQFGMAPVVILLLITISFSSVAGLKCWKCHDDFMTDDPSPEFCKNGLGVEKDCSEVDSCQWRAFSNGEVYMRGCTWDKAEEVGCKPLENDQGGGERRCVCKTDLCNGGATGSMSSEQQQQSEESKNNQDKKVNGTDNNADGDKNGSNSSSPSCSLPLMIFGALGVIAARKFKFPLIFCVLIALASFSSVSGLKCFTCIDKSDKSVNLCADGKIGMEADCEEGTKTCIYTKNSTTATEIELQACGDAIDHEQEPGSCVPHIRTTVLCSCATDLCNGNPLQNSQHSSDSSDTTSSSTSFASLLKIPQLFLAMATTFRFFWAK